MPIVFMCALVQSFALWLPTRLVCPNGNTYAPTGRERMYNSVVYDNLSDIYAKGVLESDPGNPGHCHYLWQWSIFANL